MTPMPKPKPKVKRSKAIPLEVVLAVFVRDNYTCQSCRIPQTPEQHSLHIHHLVKRSQGGKHNMENLATLCWECHAKIEQGDKWKEYELLKRFIPACPPAEYERRVNRIADLLGV